MNNQSSWKKPATLRYPGRHQGPKAAIPDTTDRRQGLRGNQLESHRLIDGTLKYKRES